jgi:NADH-quinone oxidoreductase subunit L
MLVLLLADNLVVLLLGWEGVGLCSYLLIGFWYEDAANGRAARKAFIVTRIGDTSLLIGLFVLFHALGTLRIDELLRVATETFPQGGAVVTAASLLLLGGAVGKSAQIPLQVWLPDAMAGPSPVSALIHAATMVTAGVYLIARLHLLFSLSPLAELFVGITGAATLLIASCSALVTRDLKRALAYSTISQIGYMFLALGVGSWTAAIFHFATHAFFKSLLFLAGGVVIVALHDEHDIFKMGGLRQSLPLVFWTFLAGAASLAALPFLTAGFYSKDLILKAAWEAPHGKAFLICGLVGAFLTSLYSFRLVFTVFFGEEKTAPHFEMGLPIRIPLVVLAFCSLFAGLGKLFFTETGAATSLEGLVLAVIPLLGLGLAYWVYVARKNAAQSLLEASAFLRGIQRFWMSGWGFDWLYDRLFVRPFLVFSKWNKGDFIDAIYRGVAAIAETLHEILSFTQSGLVRVYVVGLALGALFFTAMMVFL